MSIAIKAALALLKNRRTREVIIELLVGFILFVGFVSMLTPKNSGTRMKPKIENDTVLIRGVDDKMTARINRLLIEKGIDVYRIEEHVLSLEDIFLKLTGKGGAL